MEITGLSNPNNMLLFDEVRQTWVKATPEEQVRQQWLKLMIGELHYPRELLVVEKKVKELPHLPAGIAVERRIDILCYGKEIHPSCSLYPLLLIECKEGPLTHRAVEQVIGYNHHVKAHFVAAVSLDEVKLGYFDHVKRNYSFYSIFPSFKELIKWVK